MLKRLKAQVSQVANEIPGVRSPGANSDRSNSNEVDNSFSSVSNLEDGEIEGFLCPMCMTHFPSPEDLSNHFENAHGEPSPASVANPNFDVSASPNGTGTRNAAVFDSKDKEIEELRLQINEEKTFARKLKEELDRIQSVVAQATDVPDGEVPYLMQQIQVLEAGKSMVTQRMLELEKESTQLGRSLENSKQEKGDIMVKLKQLSQQIRDVTDENEANKVEKEQFCQELVKCRNQIQTMEKEIDVLNQNLDQRPSEDDVNVLRTELVNAQKLMDDISQQKDVEIEEHLHSIRHLNMEREKEHCILDNLQKQLQDSGASSQDYSSKFSSVSSELEKVQQLFDVSQHELTAARTDISEKEKRITELQSRLDMNVKEVASCRDKIQHLEATISSGAKDIQDSHDLNESNQLKLQQLGEKLEQLIHEKKKYEDNLVGSEDKMEKLSETIRTLETANLDLTNELSSLGSILEQERSLIAEKNGTIQSRDETINELRGSVEGSERKLTKLNKELDDSLALIDGLRKQTASLESNSKDLMAKVSEGEGGAKMAIDQLTEEKQQLAKTISELEESAKKRNEELSAQVESLHQKSRELETGSAEKVQRLEEDLEQVRRKLREADDELSRKAERFVEMEKENGEERQRSSDRVTKLRELIQQKDTSIHDLRSQIEKLTADLADSEATIREKERHLEHSRQSIEESVKKLEIAEAKARQLEGDLAAADALRTTAVDSENEVRDQLMEKEKFVAELKSEAVKLTAALKDKESELAALSQELQCKEQHWNTKREEFESQMDKNQETNEELLQSVNELKLAVANEKAEKEAKEVRIVNLESSISDSSTRIVELESQLESQSASVQDLEKEIEAKKADLAELQSNYDAMKTRAEEDANKLKALEQSVAECREEADSAREALQREQTENQARLEEMTREKEAADSSLEEKEAELHRMAEVVTSLEATITEREVEIDICNQQIKNSEEEVECVKVSLAAMEEAGNEKVRGLTELQEKYDSDLKNAESSMAALQKELESQQNEFKEKVDIIRKLEQKCTQFEKLSRDIQLEREREVAEKQAEVERLTESVSETQTALAARESELSSEIEKMKRSMQSCQSELDSRQSDLLMAQSTSEELTKKNMELTQQMASWEEEKNALIERCLNTESDLEFERERAMENKRRFDESLSAMHELGRANQSLQMDISKHTTRKWLDDSAAVNCTACGKGFSLTIRKHHCRVCGLIYCGPCSDRTVRIASHKNPVRVCGNCHTEVMNR